MTKADKRILELWFHAFYMWYVSNNSRHNHGHFLLLPGLLQTNLNYNEDIISEVWKEYLITNSTPPSDDEYLLAMTSRSNIFKCGPKMFSPFFKLRKKNHYAKRQTFRNLPIILNPKIIHESFHENLLTYVKQLWYTFNGLNVTLL